MRNTLGLRVRIALRLTVALMLSSGGVLLASASFTSEIGGAIVGIGIWIGAVFVALIVGLQSLIVLIEETVSSMDR